MSAAEAAMYSFNIKVILCGIIIAAYIVGFLIVCSKEEREDRNGRYWL